LKINKNILFLTITITIIIIVFINLSVCIKNIENENIKSEKVCLILSFAESISNNYGEKGVEQLFAELVNKRTNGRIKIVLYNNSNFYDEKSTIEQVQFGGIDFARVSVSSLSEYVKALNVVMIPDLFESKTILMDSLNEELGELLFNQLLVENFIGIGWLDTGEQYIFNSKQFVTDINNFNNMKIFIPESQFLIDFVANLSGIAVPHQQNDIYNYFENGFVDAALNNLETYYNYNLYKVAKYITKIDGIYIPDIIISSLNSMFELSKEDQKIIKQAAKETGIYQREIIKQQNSLYTKKLKAKITDIKSIKTSNQLNEKYFSSTYDYYSNKFPEIFSLIEEGN
jgi:TRAP-type C4-dicarboxylate transport system substrate-binding protein